MRDKNGEMKETKEEITKIYQEFYEELFEKMWWVQRKGKKLKKE